MNLRTTDHFRIQLYTVYFKSGARFFRLFCYFKSTVTYIYNNVESVVSPLDTFEIMIYLFLQTL